MCQFNQNATENFKLETKTIKLCGLSHWIEFYLLSKIKCTTIEKRFGSN